MLLKYVYTAGYIYGVCIVFLKKLSEKTSSNRAGDAEQFEISAMQAMKKRVATPYQLAKLNVFTTYSYQRQCSFQPYSSAASSPRTYSVSSPSMKAFSGPF